MVSRPEQRTEAPPERNAAKEQLVSTVAAAWGTSAAGQLVAAIKNEQDDEQVRALLEELARDILAEAQKRFGHNPVLAEVWRAAANEAACARFSAVDHDQ